MAKAGATKPRSGTHRKLTPELIEKVRLYAPTGAPDKTIAAACGVSEPAWYLWLKNARSGNGTQLEVALLEALHKGRSKGELDLVDKLIEGDSKDSQWLLTHSPHWRENWSDSAATRRELNKAMAQVADVIESATFLTAEQQTRLLLALQSRGLAHVAG